jgi:beta-lactamase regulating signal transducer with metallopeptidase domain
MSSFLEIVASNALLVTVLAVILVGLGRVWKQAASMHVLWVLVLLKLFVPPVFTIGIPAPAGRQEVASRAEEPRVAPTVDAVSAEAVSKRVDGELPWAVTYGEQAAPRAVGASVPVVVPVAVASPVTAEVESARVWNWPPWSVWLVCVWAAGTVLIGIACRRRLMAFQRLLRSAEEPGAELRRTAERIGARLGLRRVPQILVVDVRLSPMVWALGGRARVVLPKDLIEQLGEPGREAILAHELAHVRRGDHVVRWVELMAIVVFWWHPVVWWARRELRELEEQCCDGMVLDILPDAGKSYAVSLVETLRFLSETSFMKPLAATGAKPGASLARRIAMLKDYRNAGVRLTIGRALLLLALAAVPMAVALAAESKQPAEKEAAKPLVPASPWDAGMQFSTKVQATPKPAQRSQQTGKGAVEQQTSPVGANPFGVGRPAGDQKSKKEAKPRTEPVAASAAPTLPSLSPPQYVDPARNASVVLPKLPAPATKPDQSYPDFDRLGRRVKSSEGQQVDFVNAQEPEERLGIYTTNTAPRKRAIFRLNNAPALDVAETIRTLYDGEMKANPGSKTPDVVISSDAVSNCLLVSASEDDLAQIEDFIKTLDAPKSMVRVEMLIAQVGSFDSEEDGKKVRERLLGLGKSGGVDSEEFGKQIAELREQKALTVLSRPQIMTLDNQPAFVQVGEALVGKPDDGPVPGVMVGLTPRIAENLVLMEVDVEITRAESAGKAVVTKGSETAEDTLVPMRRMVTTTVQTTTSVADGRTVILGGLTSGGDTEGEDLIVVLTPHIVTQGPRPMARRRQAEPLGPVKAGTSTFVESTTTRLPAPIDPEQQTLPGPAPWQPVQRPSTTVPALPEPVE